MKNIFKLCAASVLVLSSIHTAFAGSQSAELKVQGKLVMGSCTPELSSGGIADFGAHSIATLDPTNVNQLGSKHMSISINCDSPTVAGWTFTDDRKDTVEDTKPVFEGGTVATSTNEFGLGQTAEGVNLGSYAISLSESDALIDGVKGKVIHSSDKSVWSSPSYTDDVVTNDSARIYAISSDDLPVAFKTATDNFEVAAAIQNTTTLAITDDTSLDGQATITIEYL